MFKRIVFFLNFKIGLRLFGCAEKYTLRTAHCALGRDCKFKLGNIRIEGASARSRQMQHDATSNMSSAAKNRRVQCNLLDKGETLLQNFLIQLFPFSSLMSSLGKNTRNSEVCKYNDNRSTRPQRKLGPLDFSPLQLLVTWCVLSGPIFNALLIFINFINALNSL